MTTPIDYEPAPDAHLEMYFEDRISGTDDYWDESIEVYDLEDDFYDDDGEEW